MENDSDSLNMKLQFKYSQYHIILFVGLLFYVVFYVRNLSNGRFSKYKFEVNGALIDQVCVRYEDF